MTIDKHLKLIKQALLLYNKYRRGDVFGELKKNLLNLTEDYDYLTPEINMGPDWYIRDIHILGVYKGKSTIVYKIKGD